jgi:hypothetical protein
MPHYDTRTTIGELIQKVSERVGRDAEQLAMRELATPGGRERRWPTRDASFSYPPGPNGQLGGGSPEWKGQTLRNANPGQPFQGRSLPPPGTLNNPSPPLGPDQTVETVMPFRYGQGGERERDYRAAGRDLGPHLTAHLSGPSFGSNPSPSPPRDVSGYVQPIQPGDPSDPSQQGTGYQRRAPEDFDTSDDLDLVDQHDPVDPVDPDDEPVGLLPQEHRGEPKDYFLAHDSSSGRIGIFRHGSDTPAAWVRPAPGMGTSDYRIARDRRTGRIAILRRRNRDRMRRLQHEADRIRTRLTRDSLGQERQMLTMQNSINAEFWRSRPNGRGDFWNRRP